MEQQYDFAARVSEEVQALANELAEPGVTEKLNATAERMKLPPELALAACYRAAKRSGYTLNLLLDELNRQLETGKPTG